MSVVMTAKQAAHEYFGGTVSYWKLLDLAKNGKIPHVRVGERISFRRKTLDDWMRRVSGYWRKSAEQPNGCLELM